jgi:hypothetical protein
LISSHTLDTEWLGWRALTLSGNTRLPLDVMIRRSGFSQTI